MAAKPAEIDVPPLKLNRCSVAAHAEALIALERLPFWWYQGASKVFGNFSLPFRDREGNWWYQVKPGLCWPVDCFAPIDPARARPALTKSFLGFQHVVAEEAQADSHLVINAILDLQSYGVQAINAKRRNAIRKGFQNCELSVVEDPDEYVLQGCLQAWNDLSRRTGWKHALDKEQFFTSWRTLIACPGVSVIVGRDRGAGEVAGFLVTKIIGDTAYVDTIASRTEMMRTNVNDAVMYAFVRNAAGREGVSKAHYAIKSNVTKLEKFKTGLGFVPHPFPARTRLRLGVRQALMLVGRHKYDRMTGRFEDG